jgi:hypothetical protein
MLVGFQSMNDSLRSAAGSLLFALGAVWGSSGCAALHVPVAPVPLTSDARLEKEISERLKNDPFPKAKEVGL